MKYLIIVAVLSCLVWLSCGEHARLLVSKEVLNKYVVEDKDMTIEFNIYNVGTSAAYNVVLSDKSFPPGDFDVVLGSLDAKWDRIAVGTNVSHVVVLKPKIGGYFNMTAATISYQSSEDNHDITEGYSSRFNFGQIMFAKDYDRWFSPHMLDWFAFGLMTLPSLLIPFMLWYKSKSTYENVTKSKKS